MRVVEFLPALENREQTTNAEQHDRHHEGIDVARAAIAERVGCGGLALGALAADDEQHLVARVSNRVDAFGKHRSRARNGCGKKLSDSNSDVCA